MITTLLTKEDLIYQSKTNTHRYDFYYHYKEKWNVRRHECRWDTKVIFKSL